jgi:peptidyl-prolyl cis-trans isomerase B (cyclophilin B)
MAQQWNTPPALQIDTAKTYSCSMETSKGTLEINLFADAAPITVNNFVFLAKEGFYDGISFHRVINNFMIQGGDPTGSGSGGPGYRFEDEFDGNPNKHATGSLSMANAGPNTNGSQFFICHGPQPHLDGKHTVFGQVTQAGQDVVDAIAQDDTMVKVTINEA